MALAVIDVEILIQPDGEPRKGRIDPQASVAAARKGILQKAKPGADPEQYDLAVVARGRNPHLASIGIAQDDMILLVPKEDLRPDPFELVE
jgi:hypothetical protein